MRSLKLAIAIVLFIFSSMFAGTVIAQNTGDYERRIDMEFVMPLGAAFGRNTEWYYTGLRRNDGYFELHFSRQIGTELMPCVYLLTETADLLEKPPKTKDLKNYNFIIETKTGNFQIISVHLQSGSIRVKRVR